MGASAITPVTLAPYLAMQEEIEQAFQPLIGMPLWGAFRAADMQCFHFGARRHTTLRGTPTEVGDYALHVQCTWRIVGPAGIVVARGDLYYPAGEDPYLNLDEFDYEGPIPDRRTVRLDALLEERQATPLVVQGCSADRFGGFRLQFTDDFALEAFPDLSFDAEHWRLFRPGTDAPHFVVTGQKIE